ncbi:MAG TPA: hypothetical protein PK668_00710 [Myxococcota bacterium]|nr:hypothetical protein [Myxococcota bacterium]HRY95647.1 hypothetical protein [Myxococcota bacterium]HSA23111.1 hypothetical protein [Myxococcota bacterium]
MMYSRLGRRAALVGLVLGLWAVAGCGGKDAGPFGALLARLPADADLVVSMDVAEAVRTGRAWAEELQLLPLLQASQELKDLVQGQRTALDQVLAPMRDKLGLDPFKDLGLAALGLRLVPGAEPRAVVVVQGAFPPDFLKRAFPEAPLEERDGLQIARPEKDLEVALLDGVVVLAHQELAAQARKPDGKSLEALLARHPALAGKVEPGFLGRASFLLSDALKAELSREAPPAGVGLGLLTGLARCELELGREVRLGVLSADERTAESWHYLMIALADGLMGSQHAARAIAQLALALDLDRLPDVPAPVRLLLKDDAALATSLEVLLPPPAALPDVRREGLLVSLRSERKTWVALSAVAAGMLSAFIVPALMIGMAMDDLDQSLKAAVPPDAPPVPAAPPAPPSGGGAP